MLKILRHKAEGCVCVGGGGGGGDIKKQKNTNYR